jgi:sulfite reductase (ferredoxin)
MITKLIGNMTKHIINIRNGLAKKYFYDLLKPLASLETLQAEDYIDWGQEEKYSTAIRRGECAGVMIDLIATLLLEAEEKLEWSQEKPG